MKVFEVGKIEEMLAEGHKLSERSGIIIRQAIDNTIGGMNSII